MLLVEFADLDSIGEGARDPDIWEEAPFCKLKEALRTTI